MGQLDGKIIIVTGAGRGLGEVTANKIADAGAHVVVLGRNLQRLETAIAQLGDRATAFAGDLGVAADVDRVFSQIDAKFGKIDALINNAAIYDVFDLEVADPDRIRRTVDANLLAPMLCIRAATPLLRRAGGGDIINITSESAQNPYALLSAYAATKAGLETLTKALRKELRPEKIRMTAVRLGVMAGANPNTLDPETVQRFVAANAAALQSAMAGGVMKLESVAEVLLSLLTLPADLSCEFLELQPRG